jgi:hypothetical protein
MTGRIVVDSGANASSNATLDISNFAFNGGKDLIISPGTTVTVVNQDPIPHSATKYFEAPGAKKLDESGRTLKLTGTEAGDYQVTVLMDDKKPGFPLTHQWGVKVSEDAPELNFTDVAGEATHQEDAPRRHAFPAKLEFPLNLTVQFDWTPAPVVPTTTDFRVVTTGESAGKGTPQCADSTCTLSTTLQPGEYEFYIDVTGGAVTDYTVSVKKSVYLTKPAFGDSEVGAGGHGGH